MSPQEEISTFSEVGRGILQPEELNPDRLSLPIKSEVAVIYCQLATAKEIGSKSSSCLKLNNIMVIDIKGEKVDITAYNDNSGKFDAIIPLMGNDWGRCKGQSTICKVSLNYCG